MMSSLLATRIAALAERSQQLYQLNFFENANENEVSICAVFKAPTILKTVTLGWPQFLLCYGCDL
jgi:hypothetical protein